MAPEPGTWAVEFNLAGTSVHIEHVESGDPGLETPYWHVQQLLVGELSISAARGLAPGLGVGISVPWRIVRDRIRFEDLDREPYTPPEPDTHHRNETLLDIADPQVIVLLSRRSGPWTLALGPGTSIPLGRTEANPFALGRAGLSHQHIQSGTGTWTPLINSVVRRSLGRLDVSASASARFSFYENAHGYQAGSRYSATAGINGRLVSRWGASLGLAVNREEPETWGGREEDEGNLGRTDLMLTAGVVRGTPGGALAVDAKIPFRTWTRGDQVLFPIVLSLSWTH